MANQWLSFSSIYLRLLPFGGRTKSISSILSSDHPEIKGTINGVSAELTEAFVLSGGGKYFAPGEIETYMESVKRRFLIAPDSVGRILEDLIIDDKKIDRSTKECALNLYHEETLRTSLSAFARYIFYTFLDKVFERLFEPMEVLRRAAQTVGPSLSERQEEAPAAGKELNAILLMLLPVIREQGTRLYNEQGTKV